MHELERIGLRARFQALNRDNFRCQYCGATAPDVRLEVDHVIPRSLGGSNASSNLVTACFECNRGKRADRLNRDSRTIHAVVVRAVLHEVMPKARPTFEERVDLATFVRTFGGTALARVLMNATDGGATSDGRAITRAIRIILRHAQSKVVVINHKIREFERLNVIAYAKTRNMSTARVLDLIRAGKIPRSLPVDRDLAAKLRAEQ